MAVSKKPTIGTWWLLMLAGLAACTSAPGNRPDADLLAPDAAPLRCSEQLPLVIGHCIDEETGRPCVNFQSTARKFIPLSPGGVIAPIIGFQGSPMFVMAVQAEGITPGEELEAPFVEVRMTQDDQDIGGFTSRSALVSDPESPTLQTAMQLFVVSFFADEMPGLQVHVKAEVKDRLGMQWCGESDFEIGTIITEQ